MIELQITGFTFLIIIPILIIVWAVMIIHDALCEEQTMDITNEELKKFMDAHCPWYLGRWKVSDNCDKTCPITAENRDTSMCPESYDDDDDFD